MIMMQIERFPAFTSNYLFVLHDPDRHTAAVVDPGDAHVILAALHELGAELVAILNTHHHADHVGGNRELLQRYPQAMVYGGAGDRGRIPGQTVFLEDGDRITFGDRTAQVLAVPGHTRAHIAYYFPPTAQDPETPGHLFCGDTLFAGGCGRLFEGTPTQMLESLDRLAALPDTTQVWCAHEYTLDNLKFAIDLDPHNPALVDRLARVTTARQHQQPTVPSSLGLERQTNPFLRCDQPALQTAVQGRDRLQTFTRIRGRKDQW